MSELDDLIYARSDACRQKSSYEGQLETTERKLERIREAVRQVDTVKDNLQALSTRTINMENVESWKGNKYSDYQGEISSLSAAILAYSQDVDRIHDQMNLERARLENEASDLRGIIGRLAGWINTLGAQIDNFFN